MTDNPIIEQLRLETQQLMDQLRERAESERSTFRRLLVNGYDMLMATPEATESLLDPIIPRTGVVALVGTSDSGKSTFLRSLAMAVASGAPSFLGFALHPRHRSAIYVASEDDAQAITSLMQRQLRELDTPPEAYASLDFVFELDNLVENLDSMLEDKPRDLVIIDAFADLYTGPMNENNRVRSFVNRFSQLSVKHSTLVVFLHHTGKRTESLAPSKHNAIGSQGFEAKMRLVMELRPDPERHDIRHLCIVKGNYLPSDYKHDSFELRFTPGLNFVATGERVPFALLRERTEASDVRDERLEQARALRAEGKTLQQIADALGYKNISSVSRLLG